MSAGWKLQIQEYESDGVNLLDGNGPVAIPLDLLFPDQEYTVAQIVLHIRSKLYAAYNKNFVKHLYDFCAFPVWITTSATGGGENPAGTFPSAHGAMEIHTGDPFPAQTTNSTDNSFAAISDFPALAVNGAINKEFMIGYKITATSADGSAGKFKLLFAPGVGYGLTPVGDLGVFLGATDYQNIAIVSTYVAPKVDIVEVPYYTTQVVITDFPPLPPELEPVPFIGANNKIMFLFQGGTGQRAERPIIIEDSDVLKVANQYIAQSGSGILESEGEDFAEQVGALAISNTLLFKSDDPVTSFQTFRTTTPPTSYIDFKNKLRETSTEEIIPGINVSSVTYIDTISPNTRYYYCFRSIDIHGNVSNPTPIYDIEMVDNAGQIYPVIKPYQFPARESTESLAKSGRRYIYIEPTFTQQQYVMGTLENVAPDEPMGAGYIPPDNLLGEEVFSRVWNKNFKVRVTSKKTGKKMDFNITFKNSGKRNP